MGDIIYNNGAVGISIVHRGKRLVSFLACCVPYLELDCSIIVERYRLSEERGADGRLSIVIELVFYEPED